MISKLRGIAAVLILLVVSLPVVFAAELSLIYDVNGNLVTGDGKYREYNSLNQLVRIRNGNTAGAPIVEDFVHDIIQERILMKRVYNSAGNVIETVYYVDENFVRVVNTSGTYDYKYVKHEGQLVGQELNGVTYYFHNDLEGSTSVITNQSGGIVENTTYSPHGEILSGGSVSRFDSEGKEYSSVTGDYDFNFRKMNPSWGLFLQPDTLIQNVYDPQSLNRYMFERGNPYGRVDPNGRAAIWIHYQETKENYIAAGFSEADASRVAAGAIEPDLYRIARQGGKSGFASEVAAKYFGLDLQMDVMGGGAESYYHEYDKDDISEHIDELLGEYEKAKKMWDLEKMGNLEHALGHDIGTKGTPGYHAGASSYNKIPGFHNANDIFGLTVNKAELQKAQEARARAAAAWKPGDPKIKVSSSDTRNALQRYWDRVKSARQKVKK